MIADRKKPNEPAFRVLKSSLVIMVLGLLITRVLEDFLIIGYTSTLFMVLLSDYFFDSKDQQNQYSAVIWHSGQPAVLWVLAAILSVHCQFIAPPQNDLAKSLIDVIPGIGYPLILGCLLWRLMRSSRDQIVQIHADIFSAVLILLCAVFAISLYGDQFISPIDAEISNHEIYLTLACVLLAILSISLSGLKGASGYVSIHDIYKVNSTADQNIKCSTPSGLKKYATPNTTPTTNLRRGNTK